MSYHVIVQPRAQADLSELYDWIAERSPQGALRWFHEWENALAHLTEDPVRFGLAPESEWASAEVRQILFKTPRGLPYRALFSIEGQCVNVVHVRGPGQPLLSHGEL